MLYTCTVRVAILSVIADVGAKARPASGPHWQDGQPQGTSRVCTVLYCTVLCGIQYSTVQYSTGRAERIIQYK